MITNNNSIFIIYEMFAQETQIIVFAEGKPCNISYCRSLPKRIADVAIMTAARLGPSQLYVAAPQFLYDELVTLIGNNNNITKIERVEE